MQHTCNIGHRLFPRDATEDLPSRRTPFPVSTRRHLVPAFSSPGFPHDSAEPVRLWLRQTLPVAAFRNLGLKPCPAARVIDAAGHPLTHNRQDVSTRAPLAARSSTANPFLVSPADSGTRAPNLQRLRQSGGARQDLVRISESTTKCGDYGEESGGDAEVSKIRGDSERALRLRCLFHSRQQPNLPRRCYSLAARANADQSARQHSECETRHAFVT